MALSQSRNIDFLLHPHQFIIQYNNVIYGLNEKSCLQLCDLPTNGSTDALQYGTPSIACVFSPQLTVRSCVKRLCCCCA